MMKKINVNFSVLSIDKVDALADDLRDIPRKVEAGQISFYRGMKTLHRAKNDLAELQWYLSRIIACCRNHVATLEARQAMKEGREI